VPSILNPYDHFALSQALKLKKENNAKLTVLSMGPPQAEEVIRLARKAEADGAPSVALGHHLTAADLYRGTLFSDVPDAEWMDLAREQVRSRFVSCAVRAAELLHASGDPDRAAEYARHAIAEDPWAEDAHCALVDAALSAGDRSAAVRLLERCREMLRELGVEPSEQTQGLGRRLAATSS
jgi:DNA-binding SARP family transcriptional activator